MELAILLGFIGHFIGDYLLQNDYLAIQKTKKTLPALIHVLLYGLPFYFLVGFSFALLFIVVTHFFIDRFSLATYWIKLINWKWESKNYGFSEDMPKWMSEWLRIIHDNTFHVILNTLAIWYHYS